VKLYKVEPTQRALADADEAFMWLYNEVPEAALRWYVTGRAKPVDDFEDSFSQHFR
jgi:plasmid stabilization system protein ParE